MDGEMKPAAGVMATNPATAPVAVSRAPGRLFHQDSSIHVRAALAALVFVATNADEASPPEVRALPALKSNQPNQRSPARRTTMGTLCGSMAPPRTEYYATGKSERPAQMCTTVSPAKSRAPSVNNQSTEPHTQCATGQYTDVVQSAANSSYAPKPTRSATAPPVSATAVMANMPWKAKNARCGTRGRIRRRWLLADPTQKGVL